MTTDILLEIWKITSKSFNRAMKPSSSSVIENDSGCAFPHAWKWCDTVGSIVILIYPVHCSKIERYAGLESRACQNRIEIGALIIHNLSRRIPRHWLKAHDLCKPEVFYKVREVNFFWWDPEIDKWLNSIG
jgi:hypothetical protein